MKRRPLCVQATALISWLVGSLLVTHFAHAAEIDLTRHLARLSVEPGAAATHSERFFGVIGPARLIIEQADKGVAIAVTLNGAPVAMPDSPQQNTGVEVPISLREDNTLSIDLDSPTEGSAVIRIKQKADIELHVESRVHFNANVSDFAEARAFYGKLGFKTLTGFPDTNTLEMARAIGIETPTSYDGSQGETAGGYLLHGELIGVGGFEGGLIDLIAFAVPKDGAPPYTQLNHLGMARAVMSTTNIEADYRYLKSMGVEFLSAPVTRADGSRFAIFKDLDGTFYELAAVEGEPEETETTHITGLAQVNVNVSDFERSRAWYQMLGYEVTRSLAPTESTAVAKAMGLDEPFQVQGALVTHPADDSMLEIVQWITPYDPARAYPIPVNHLGLHRMAYATSDIEADVAALKAQGVQFVSPITPCCSGPDSPGSIVAFYDPDGTIVELVEQPFMTRMMSILAWFKDTFY